ncbi:hypothetical protein ZIOFF_011272 [Zingiber officinale]|uniref:Uncharacterized protein n=1 Tax=Zingiber officinale TaxID=94328 RepID=A0A8J5HKC9_ZINOF|nr:hypothetical protein ZIOFF_011272 [Zingiber officinale]
MLHTGCAKSYNSQELTERSSFTSTKVGVSASTAKNQNDQLPESLIHRANNIPKISAESSEISLSRCRDSGCC